MADPGNGGPILSKVDGPFAAGHLLNCIGAETMTPQQLVLYARGKGYPVEYRYSADNLSSEREPPAGSILTGAEWGSQGQLLVFASPPNDPLLDQLRLTAERACPKDGGSK